jgi:ABC-type transport system involved in cytochrome c biogenesis permease subunit
VNNGHESHQREHIVGMSGLSVLIGVTVLLVSAYSVDADSSAHRPRLEPVTRVSGEATTGPIEQTLICGTSSLLAQDQYPTLLEAIVLAICGTLASSIWLGWRFARQRRPQSRNLSVFIPLSILGAIITSFAWASLMAARYPTISDLDPTRREVTALLLMGLLPLSLVVICGSSWLTSRRVTTECV